MFIELFFVYFHLFSETGPNIFCIGDLLYLAFFFLFKTTMGCGRPDYYLVKKY